ncbi:MAG: hypothetical protein WDW38_010470 [Sanguina aurantia]
MSVKVLMGTCGWSDESIQRCGRVYPPMIRSSEERLPVYAQHFPCVEVDTSCYAIPRASVTSKWVENTPPGFKFHFKAYGPLCHPCSPSALPAAVRAGLPAHLQQSDRLVSLSQLPLHSQQQLWDSFHAGVEPARKAGKLGAVVFQFQLSFKPCMVNEEHVRQCRRMLLPDVDMAVEFRCRSWFTDPGTCKKLVEWLTAEGICLVAADELKHETFQRDRHQTGLPPGATKEIMDIAMQVTQPRFFYVRLHRRHGTSDRLIPEQEIKLSIWGAVAHKPQQPWPEAESAPRREDAPMVNARQLAALLPGSMRHDQQAAVHDSAAKKRGSIASFLEKGRPHKVAHGGTVKTTQPSGLKTAARPAEVADSTRSLSERVHTPANPSHRGSHQHTAHPESRTPSGGSDTGAMAVAEVAAAAPAAAACDEAGGFDCEELPASKPMVPTEKQAHPQQKPHASAASKVKERTAQQTRPLTFYFKSSSA